MQPQSLSAPGTLPSPSEPQNIDTLPSLGSDEKDTESKPELTADQKKHAKSQAVSHIMTSASKAATTAAREMRKCMGLEEDHKGGPMGAKMDAELFKALRVAAKAYYDRKNP